MLMEKEVIQSLEQALAIQLADAETEEKLKKVISERINYLIQHDFAQLTELLYRIDINEAKLKKLLSNKEGSVAADIIAELIIERQIQKAKSRKIFKQRNDNISEEDRW